MEKKIRDKIISEYISGKGSTTIVKELGISKPTILKILKEEGLTRKRDRCKSLNIIKEKNEYVLYWKCDICNQLIKRTSSNSTILCRNHYRQQKESGICKKCSLKLQEGQGNPFYGKKHSEKTLKFLAECVSKHALKVGPISKKEKFLLNEFKNINNTAVGSYTVDKYICDIYIGDLNLIIEFYGDYWHCNPKKFKYDYFHRHKKKTASQIWDEDLLRVEKIKNLGYNLEVIWESDLNDPEFIQKLKSKYVKN